MSFTGFFGGLLMMALGMSLVVKTQWYYGVFGAIPWAEEHLGLDGGSRLFYKLLGVLICFFGVLVAFDLFEGFFVSTAGQLILPENSRNAQ